MNILLVLPIMIFLHIVDDFYLQGTLASFKQKEWIKKHYPEAMYKNDWFISLYIHAFSWSFMIHTPLLLYAYHINNRVTVVTYLILLIIQSGIHAYVDNLKANRKSISLTVDQLIHLAQIIYSWVSLYRIVSFNS